MMYITPPFSLQSRHQLRNSVEVCTGSIERRGAKFFMTDDCQLYVPIYHIAAIKMEEKNSATTNMCKNGYCRFHQKLKNQHFIEKISSLRYYSVPTFFRKNVLLFLFCIFRIQPTVLYADTVYTPLPSRHIMNTSKISCNNCIDVLYKVLTNKCLRPVIHEFFNGR